MARLTRLVVPGHPHVVVQRGHGDRPIWIDDLDRQAYVDALRDAAAAHGLKVHAYALGDDEVTWMATPRDAAALGRAVQAIGQRFVTAFNRRHGVRGTRWEGRFRSAIVEERTLGLSVCTLLEQRVVTRGLAAAATDWPWSSAQHHAGLRRESWLVELPSIWALGNTPFEREAAYGAQLAQPVGESLGLALANAVSRGWALGSPAFIERLQVQAGRAVRPKRRGRPRVGNVSPINEYGNKGNIKMGTDTY